MKTKKRSFGINVGSSSILMIFVILCLVSFAVLSIVSAQSDYKLSEKLADRTSTYYGACNDAENHIANLAERLSGYYRQTSSAEEYFALAGTEETYSVIINEQQDLVVKVTILYPPTDNALYRIDSWQVITKDDMQLDDTLNLLDEEEINSFDLPF